jgi:hypothetical protein
MVNRRQILRALVITLWALAPGLSGPDMGRAQAQMTRPDDTSREILVMLTMSPAHYRPGQGYGGAYGDTTSVATRRRVALGIARRHRLELVDGWPMPLLGVDCYAMRVPVDIDLAVAIEQVSREPMVAWSQALRTYHARGSTAPPGGSRVAAG